VYRDNTRVVLLEAPALCALRRNKIHNGSINAAVASTAAPTQSDLVVTETRSRILIDRIFHGESVPASPENALSFLDRVEIT
jgi:hypothetical protein